MRTHREIAEIGSKKQLQGRTLRMAAHFLRARVVSYRDQFLQMTISK